MLLTLIPLNLTGQEDCFNGIDDDTDGLIDLYDDECSCSGDTLFINPDIIPNPKFLDHNCIPSDFDDFQCVNEWIRPSYATSDYYYYESIPDSSFFPTYPPNPTDGLNGIAAFLDSGEFVPFTNSYEPHKEYSPLSVV